MKSDRDMFRSESVLNQIICSQCGQLVADQAPACPNCGAKVNVELPADITPVRNDPKAKIPASQKELGDR